MNQNTSGTAASLSAVLSANLGGNGVANTATHTLGTSNQNWATLGTGIVKNTTTTGAISNAVAADVSGLWSGTCNSSTFLRGDGACQTPGGSGTVTVVSSGSLTSTALVTGGGTTTLQTPSATATMDSSGNVSTPGSITTGAGGSVGGYWAAGQGTATTAPTSSVGFMAPTSVTTKFMMTLPAAPTTGFILNTGTTDPTTLSYVASNGSGNVLLSAGTAAIASGKTLTASNSLTLAGTDSTTMTFPSTSASIARTDAANTFTGVQTMTSPAITTPAITGLATGSGVAAAATASTLATRDANANLTANSVIKSYTTTATAAGTTTLTVGSTQLQYFTGSTTQTVTLPVTSTLVLGQQFEIVNNSTGAVTVNSSGSNAVVIMAGSTRAMLTCILTSGTTAASWSYTYIGDVITSGKSLSVSNSLTLAGTDGTTMTFPSTSATIARTDAANTFTGVQTMTSPALTTPAITGVSTGSGVATAATASTLALRNASGEVIAVNTVATGKTPVATDTTDTLTNKSLDAEGTGNVLTIPFTIWLPASGCNNATAASFWDLPTSTPAVATCITGTNTQKGVLAYADTTGGFSAQTEYLLPTDFTGAIDARIIWNTSATSGNAKWSLSTVCTDVAASATDDAAFNTASTVTTAAPGTTLRLQTSTITGLTATGCSAGNFLHLKLFRDGNDGSDTISATANVIGVELKIRRAM